MLNVTTSTDCQLFTLTTPTDLYIDQLDNPDNDTCCTILNIGQNCCADKYFTHYLRHLYPLVMAVDDCEQFDEGGVTYHRIFFSFTGVLPSCLSSITHQDTPSTTVTTTNPTSNLVSFTYQDSDVGPTTVFSHQLILRTCEDNLEYTINYTFNPNDFVDPCDYVFNQVSIDYPALPSGVVINGSSLEISPDAIGETTFDDGVYYFALTQNNIPLTNKTFLDCNTQCKVIDLVAQDTCNIAYSLYEALSYAEQCDTITYEQMCQIWQYLGVRLGYFETSPCETTSDCGCN